MHFDGDGDNRAGFAAKVEVTGRSLMSRKASGSVPIAGTDSAPFDLEPGAVPAIKFFLVRSLRRDPMVAVLTSGAGAFQRVPFDDVISVASRAVPFSAISIVGVGVIEYVLAGD